MPGTAKNATKAAPLMHEHIREKCELAIAYAEDGAYSSAQRVLSEIAKDTLAHVMRLKSAGIY